MAPTVVTAKFLQWRPLHLIQNNERMKQQQQSIDMLLAEELPQGQLKAISGGRSDTTPLASGNDLVTASSDCTCIPYNGCDPEEDCD